jgi:hypothetical protein
MGYSMRDLCILLLAQGLRLKIERVLAIMRWLRLVEPPEALAGTVFRPHEGDCDQGKNAKDQAHSHPTEAVSTPCISHDAGKGCNGQPDAANDVNL